MNVFVWILQVALALVSFAGGAYKVFQYQELAKTPAAAALSRGAWGAIGVFEIVCALLLVIPAATRRLPVLTPLAAAALALESIGLGVLYGQYSLAMTATNPLVYVAGMALVAAFVGYVRFASRPQAG